MQEGSFLNPALAVRQSGLHEGMKVADFGSGSGFFTRAAAHAVGHGGQVFAIDAHRDMLLHTRNLSVLEGLRNIEIVAGDLESRQGSHLPAESMDLVIAANLLFFAEDKERIVEEMWRVLKKTGKALVIDWKGSFGGLGPHPSHVLVEKDARLLFERGGFSFLKEVPSGAYHWGCVMRKRA